MGTRGPVPKRSTERVRRNKDSSGGSITKIHAIGRVPQPDLGLDDPHPIVADWYASLAQSAQAQYYEPSDWQTARLVAYTMDRYIKAARPSSQMFAALSSAMSDLLVTEGSRRRVRLEVEREQAKAEVLDVAAMFRERNSN